MRLYGITQAQIRSIFLIDAESDLILVQILALKLVNTGTGSAK